MIKVENGVCEIETSEGVPGMMTDLSIAVRSVKTTIVEKGELNEDQAKDLISHAVRLGLLTNEEVAKETMDIVGKAMMILLKHMPL